MLISRLQQVAYSFYHEPTPYFATSILYFYLSALTLLTLTGCQKQPVQSNNRQSSPSPAIPPAGRPAPLPIINGRSEQRFYQPFQADLARINPQQDGWDTEAFSEQAAAQLKALEDQIAHTPDNKLSKLVDHDFSSSRLRPEQLVTTFQDRSLTVRRSRSQGNSAKSAAPYQGSSGLRQAIEELLAPLGKDIDVHVHFKLFRVVANTDNDSVTTTAYFQLGGRTEHGSIQQNALWHCRWRPATAGALPLLQSIRVQQFEEAISSDSKTPLFDDCTEAVIGRSPAYRQQLSKGIDHWADSIDLRLGLDIVATHGLAIGDVDGDGLEDLFLCEPGGLPNRLFLQKLDGTARDISTVAGVDYLEPARSALLLDLDNDDDQDLILGSDRFVIFLENDGLGRFSQRAAFRMTSSVVSLAAADYDNDGDLDVYACGNYTLKDAAGSSIGLGNPLPYHDANNGGRNALLRSDGDWKFTDVTAQTGLDQHNTRFSLAASWEDYDNDGDTDLYVANDYGRNCLYRNDQGRFIDVAAEAGVEDISAGMSVSWGDYNRDGLPDIYISNMFSSAGNRITYQRQFKTAASDTTRGHYQRHARGNSLFENVGDGTFRDVSVASGVTMGRWAWGANFLDINNDGWEDLLVTNGMLTRRQDTDDL